LNRNQDVIKITLFLFTIVSSSSQIFADGNGGFAGGFLRVGLGARALGMGNAQVATADNGFGSYYNAASLPYVKRPVVSLSYSFMSLDRRFNYLGFSMPLEPVAGFSVGWIYSGVGDIRAYNSRGDDVGAIDHGIHGLSFGFGFQFVKMIQQSGQLLNLPENFLNIGIQMKYVREGLDDNADFSYVGKGFGFDIGILLNPFRFLSLGYQVKDLGSKLESDTNNIFDRGTVLENKFPIIQRAGFYYQTPLSLFYVAYDFEWSDAGDNKNHVGLEFRTNGEALRLGYDDNHFTFGAGLNIGVSKKLDFVLDYAFVNSVVNEGTSHVFSWQFYF